MIRGFEDFAAPLLQASSLNELRGAVIGIEAGHYLNSLLASSTHREPLRSALGGLPFSMEDVITKDLRTLQQQYGVDLYFVFDGVMIQRGTMPFRDADQAVHANETAWELYNQHHADQAVAAFGKSGAAKVEDLYRYLQVLLKKLGIQFQVAPHRAPAQLAYLERECPEVVDAIYGSPETLLWDIQKLITKLDPLTGEFAWITRKSCLEALGNIPPDMFVDACLLAGCDLLPSIPDLERAHPRNGNIRAALDMLSGMGRKGISVCKNFRDDPEFRDMQYLERFCKAFMAVKHGIVLTKEGNVEPLDLKNAPGDMHEFNGQRLPDELYYYLSRGAIGPRVLNWRVSGEILEFPPLDNGESEQYHRLVREQLVPIKTTALSLLSYSLHRFYQHKDVTLRLWFDRNDERSINLRDLQNPQAAVGSWNVKEFQNVKYDAKDDPLGFAIRCFSEPGFLTNSITPKDKLRKTRVQQNGPTEVSEDEPPLTSQEEVLYNTIWRFLQLRDYLDAQHNLTNWGKALCAASKKAGPNAELQEAALVGLELLRLDLLTSDFIFRTYSHGPIRGSDEDRKNCLLVSRVACMGRLNHKAIGYTGPLSRHLLGYHSITTAVRRSLRDLEDMCLATLLLNGDTQRDRKDLQDIALELPFLTDLDCGLAILVKSYLDELAGYPDPASPETRQKVRTKGPLEWLPHSTNFGGDLIKAFKIWDAIYEGVKVAGDLVKDRKMFDNANEWVKDRRWTDELESEIEKEAS